MAEALTHDTLKTDKLLPKRIGVYRMIMTMDNRPIVGRAAGDGIMAWDNSMPIDILVAQ